jgi:lipopolysaccharide transport system ATP-binding protein
MMNDIAIQVDGLAKRYGLGGGLHHNTLRDLLTDGFRNLFSRNGGPQKAKNSFWALKEVSFRIAQGENVGIIGLNGAGKSTLLKILSRITEPTEVGTGFHWELSGRENVFLYGAILGMSKQEITAKFDAIVEFAGIKEFIDTPVKRYSSGMYVRLAFAVAAHLEPEILLIDEVLSVGDLPFQRKCMEFAKNLQQGNATILFVSHNMFSIKTMCRRVIYLKQGRVQFDGPTDEGIKLYEENCRLETLWTETKPEKWPIKVTAIELLDDQGVEKGVFAHGERMRIRLRYAAARELERPGFVVAFIRSDGVACCNFSTDADGFDLGRVSGEGTIELHTPPLRLVADLYTIHILVREQGFQKVLCAQIGATFHISHHLLDRHFGVYHEPGRWEHG